MRSKLLIGGLLSSVVIVSAFAQSSPAPTPATPPAAMPPATTTIAPVAKSDMWRSSKLIGLNVYNEQNEKLGDISEILLDKQGKVEGVIVGVGGFLGMGQRDIKVELSKLKFVDEPVKTSSNATTTTSTTGAGTQRPATTTTTTTSSNDRKWYPDHAVLSGATKDQLKAMPEFKYN